MNKIGIILVILAVIALFAMGNNFITGNAVNIDKMEGRKVVLETNMGDIVIQLYDNMPITTSNFEALVVDGFYDGVKFHRVIEDFMIQGGDPLTKDDSKKHLWGTGGPGYKIKDEFNDNGNLRGTISMANAGPNTGGSQFFINLADNNFLDGKHPVFGKVVEGMDVVDSIASIDVDGNDRPVEDVIILKARVK